MSRLHEAGCFSLIAPLFRRKQSWTAADCKHQQAAAKQLLIPEDANVDISSLMSTDDAGSHLYVPPPQYSARVSEASIYRPEVLKTIEDEIKKVDPELRKLSLIIHDNPELGFEEKIAHDTLTAFMSSHGFSVETHYLGIDTAWKASYAHGSGGRVIGVNSEMDAMRGLGHACGRNLIAIMGVGISLAIKAALESHNIPGKIILLGTPAESHNGKVTMMNKGAYNGMDACLMAHPGAGVINSSGTGPGLGSQAIEVEYFGRGAHASAAPWEGKNALDAAVIAYSSVSMLRQQIYPTHNVQGVIEGKDWLANTIPDYAKMKWIVRAPTKKETEVLRERVMRCFQAAAIATDTQVKTVVADFRYPFTQNTALAQDFTEAASKYKVQVSPEVSGGVGGDFGIVTNILPALHPSYAIPTKPNGGNHTALFAAAARTKEAHKATLVIAQALAHTGFRVIDDDQFFSKVQASFKEQVNTKEN